MFCLGSSMHYLDRGRNNSWGCILVKVVFGYKVVKMKSNNDNIGNNAAKNSRYSYHLLSSCYAARNGAKLLKCVASLYALSSL